MGRVPVAELRVVSTTTARVAGNAARTAVVISLNTELELACVFHVACRWPLLYCLWPSIDDFDSRSHQGVGLRALYFVFVYMWIWVLLRLHIHIHDMRA